MMHLPPERIHVVDIGVEERFCPGGQKTPNPHVVAVGRLVPVKQFDDLIRNLVEVKRQVPALTASIIGEGSKRSELEALRDELGAHDWITFLGKISDEELISAYRSAWLVTSTSAREGWGMTLTEAAACGTPALASDIAGHRDAVDDGVSGILVQDQQTFVFAMTSILTDERRREQLSNGALTRARQLSWNHTALELFKLIGDQA
jgi:glycosyltransferase involved in cell wall biosynthesis